MTYEPCTALALSEPWSVCLHCGSIVQVQGQTRHDAWHEFLESGLTGLTADVAALSVIPPAS